MAFSSMTSGRARDSDKHNVRAREGPKGTVLGPEKGGTQVPAVHTVHLLRPGDQRADDLLDTSRGVRQIRDRCVR